MRRGLARNRTIRSADDRVVTHAADGGKLVDSPTDAAAAVSLETMAEVHCVLGYPQAAADHEERTWHSSKH